MTTSHYHDPNSITTLETCASNHLPVMKGWRALFIWPQKRFATHGADNRDVFECPHTKPHTTICQKIPFAEWRSTKAARSPPILISKGVTGVLEMEEAAATVQGQGQTVVFVAIDRRAAGAIAVADRIKASTPEAVRALHQAGIEIIMLTGDNERTASAVARQPPLTKPSSDSTLRTKRILNR